MSKLVEERRIPNDEHTKNLLWKSIFLLTVALKRQRGSVSLSESVERAELLNYLQSAASSLTHEINESRQVPKVGNTAYYALVRYCAELASIPHVPMKVSREMAADAFCCLLRYHGIRILPIGSSYPSRMFQRFVLLILRSVDKVSKRDFMKELAAVYCDLQLELIFKRRLSKRLATCSELKSRHSAVARLVGDYCWHQEMTFAKRNAFAKIEQFRSRHANDAAQAIYIATTSIR